MKKMLSLLMLLNVFACSTANIATVNNKLIAENNQDIINISSINGAKLSVKINFDNSFKVKVSSDGVAAKTTYDIKSVKLYLVKTNSNNPLINTNVQFSSSIINYPAGNTAKTYTFFNVPAGTYYVAAELFANEAGTENIIEPIAYDSLVLGDTAFGMTDGKRGLTLSTNSATVTAPAMTFSFSDSSSAFNVSPKLLDAVGASLNTIVTTQAGSNTPPGTITIQ